MSYIYTIFFRYASLALQFVLMVLIARRLSPEDAGIYFQIFGAVAATFFLAGFGIPDGLVRAIAHANASEDKTNLRAYIRRGGIFAGASSIFTAILAVAAFGIHMDLQLVICGAIWWLCYGLVFFSSQVLVSAGRPSLAAFFYYPAMNVALFTTSVPYLIFAESPNIRSVMEATVAGASVCCACAMFFTLTTYRSFPKSNSSVRILPIIRLGFSLANARVLQSSLYWIPVWAVGFYSGAAAAGLMGTAARLNVAFAAIMAAVRFSIRPEIVRLAARGDWSGIRNESRKAATVATLLTVVVIVTTVFVGRWIIGAVFGEGYQDAAWLLAVLLVGTLGECIGGPVDEILKMTARAHIVLKVLAVSVVAELALIWLFASYGAVAMAAAQAVSFMGMYGFYLWWLKREQGVYVGAVVTSTYMRSLLSRTDV